MISQWEKHGGNCRIKELKENLSYKVEWCGILQTEVNVHVKYLSRCKKTQKKHWRYASKERNVGST